MKLWLTILMTFSLSSLFGASREESFWRWFEANDARLFHFENDQERVFNELTRELHKLHSALTFEFGPETDGRREFVISADGLRDAFPEVIALHETAPKLKRWVFIKFRPRRNPMDLKLPEMEVKAATVRVLIGNDKPGKLGLKVLFPGFEPTKERSFTQAAFLLLDQALGEYDVETKVGYIGAGAIDHNRIADSYSLDELPAAFDRLLQSN